MHRFAFMIHPLDINDITRKFPLARHLPSGLLERAARYLPPLKTSYINGVRSPYAETEGWFVACPLTTRQMLSLPEKFVIERIIRTGRLAEKLGAEILGLGAMTSVVGDAGITVARNLNIAVTTGNSYTVATAIEATEKAAAMMDIDLPRAEVAIVGATGSIGAVCAKILARRCQHLTLIARNETKLARLAGEIKATSGLKVRITSHSREALRRADVIITVTSAVDTVIEPEDLKPGAVVCDVARPRDVSRRVAEMRDDVLVIDGGVVEVPGNVNFNFNFGYPPGLAYACMAETMILALEGRIENFTLGRELTVEQIDIINRLAAKHGFRVAGFRSFELPVSEARVAAIRERARRKAALAR
ncbi:Quinate/shikimate 5-dehydrogenase/glutamyl-tRNA reductase [Moorella glycerini]|uniref:Long-chain acyl-[acyl-carrier-protein] reductase n=1 Tax=Neomoorella stamsii TaxID=1266720 RepID=A0A9X7J693_9FIRM|nr:MULTISPECIES: polysaccharide biosynthesis protein [Moorella]PRR77873.1 Long-chain acyl-[acyl-carrier-protein] reductase [Moorella stamsii]CEP68982.1 Quinate/shikimate 5-dehydrogenase/glutamyl-tRNA reductase [Moorella glycerini]